MKKILVGLTLLALILGLSTVAYGSSGKAIIPPCDFSYMSSGDYFQPNYYVTNITNSTISVTITFYNKNGSILTSGVNGSNNLINFNSSPSNATVTFDLAANSTGYVYVSLSSRDWGYGIIGWTQNSTAVCGLIAHGNSNRASSSGFSVYALPINNGLPF